MPVYGNWAPEKFELSPGNSNSFPFPGKWAGDYYHDYKRDKSG